MPRRRNRQYQGYDRGYNQPTVREYESFFNPIPLEFLQQNLAERQQKYDVAFQGAMGATGQLRESESAMTDLAFKNELVNKGVKNINKMVTEKYGGDWGKASKEVARQITQLRADPFWESTKYLKEQQKLKQAFTLQHPDAHIYTDPSQVGAIDPKTGQPRSMEQMTFRGEEKGKWQQSVTAQYKDLESDVIVGRLKKLTGELEGYAGIKTIADLTDTQLMALANDPYAIETFLENNRDFARSKMEIDGMDEEQVKKAAGAYIFGQIKHKERRVESQQIVKDEEFFIKMKARAASAVTSGIVTGGSGDFIALAIDNPKKLRKQMAQAKDALDSMPAGPQKTALQKQYDRDIRNHEFIMMSVQNSQYAISIDDYYNTYKAEQEKMDPQVRGTALTREEFEQTIYDSVGIGELPEKEQRTVRGYMGIETLMTDSKALFNAGKALRDGMKKFVKEDGQFAINVNVLGGETGRKDTETYVGRLNIELTDMWKGSATAFSLPYSNQQITTLLEEDRRYNGKKAKTLKRDAKRDRVFMTDGTMDGKVVYQLNIFDKEGTELGSEYITPNNQTIAQGNIINAAHEMRNSNDPNKVRIGTQILGNVLYGPLVQLADIYKNSEGGLGIEYEGNEIMFEKIPGPTPSFVLYTQEVTEVDGQTVKGEKDPFELEDKNGNAVLPLLTTEKEIQHMLMVINLSQSQ